MRVKQLWWLLVIFLVPPALAEDTQPDADLLEYLGEWAGTDKDWADPVDILDMKLNDDTKQVETETKK